MTSLSERAQIGWSVSGCCHRPPSFPAMIKDFDSDGFKDAYLYAVSIAERDPFQITENDITTMHKRLCRETPQFFPGMYRTDGVFLHGSKYRFPMYYRINHLMKKLCKDERELFLLSPVVAAATFHQALVDIHPFFNGNGRVARLCMNAILLHYGHWPLFVTADWREEYSAALLDGQINDNKSTFINLIVEKVEQNERIHRKEVSSLE